MSSWTCFRLSRSPSDFCGRALLRTWRLRRPDAAVTALSLFIRDLCLDAQLEVSFVRYEDEDAHIWVTLPPSLAADEREALANRLAERSLDILLMDGILILTGVDEADE